MTELTPEVLDNTEARIDDRRRYQLRTPFVVDEDLVLALVAAARERDELRAEVADRRRKVDQFAADLVAFTQKTADAIQMVATERDVLRATVARVEALHVVDPTIVDEYAYCRECSEVWPCDTARALRGEDQ